VLEVSRIGEIRTDKTSDWTVNMAKGMDFLGKVNQNQLNSGLLRIKLGELKNGGNEEESKNQI
jgi:hypothetical protein